MPRHDQEPLADDPPPKLYKNMEDAMRALKPELYGPDTVIDKKDPRVKIIWMQHKLDYGEKLKAWKLRNPEGAGKPKRLGKKRPKKAHSSTDDDESSSGLQENDEYDHRLEALVKRHEAHNQRWQRYNEEAAEVLAKVRKLIA